MDNEQILGFLLLISLYGLILIPVICIIGYHLIIFIIEKWINKEAFYQLPYLRVDGDIINANKLISFVDLVYLFKKDSARLISMAIQNGLLFPLYKNSFIKIKEENFFECYPMYFESNLFNCYDNYINNIYFFKNHVINLKNIYEDTLLSNDFYVPKEKVTTEKNILEVIRNCIRKAYYINPRITSLKECIDKIIYLTVQIIRCSILNLYGYFFLSKPDISFNKEKIDKYYNELIFDKKELTLIDIISSRSRELFTLYVKQQGKLTKNEKVELYFWGRLFIPANELVDILDPGKISTEAKKQKAYTARKQFKEHFSGKDVKFTDVMPLLHKEFLNDNILD